MSHLTFPAGRSASDASGDSSLSSGTSADSDKAEKGFETSWEAEDPKMLEPRSLEASVELAKEKGFEG